MKIFISIATVSIIFMGSIYAGDVTLDTGKLKIVAGRDGGGSIDEAWLDRNDNGKYEDNECVILRPADQPGLVVAWVKPEKQTGVIIGKRVIGKVTAVKAIVNGHVLTINGVLDFGEYGKSPFKTIFRGEKNSPIIHAEFSFTPLSSDKGLALSEATLRIYGDFEKGPTNAKGEKWTVERQRLMDGKPFGNLPRPETPWQRMVWNLGGKLVESPWYWQKWVSWSGGTGPVTTQDGSVAPKILRFMMHDTHWGMEAATLYPEAAAPVELSGSGLPCFLAISAWPSRVTPLLLKKNGPKTVGIKNVAIHFFATKFENIYTSSKFWDSRAKAVNTFEEILTTALRPVKKSFRDTRYSEKLLANRITKVSNAEKRGWEAEIAAVPVKRDSFSFTGTQSGKNSVSLRPMINCKKKMKGTPVSGGVPFPKGALISAKNLVLKNKTGSEIPIQTECLAMWPDKSIKWALITASPKSLSPDETWFLEYGPGKTHKARPAKKLLYKKTDTGIIVDTGVVKFSVKKNGSGFLDEVWFDKNGNGSYDVAEKVVDAEKTKTRNVFDLAAISDLNSYPPLAYYVDDAQKLHGEPVVDDIIVEREGVIELTIRINGHYRFTGSTLPFPFWIRLTACAGEAFIKIKHVYIYEGSKPDTALIQNIHLSLPLNSQIKTFESQGDEQLFSIPVSKGGGAGVSQNNARFFEAWQNTGSESGYKITNAGRTSGGWARLKSDNLSIGVGICEMALRHAKAICVEYNTLKLFIWPARARLLDTRRYSRQYGDGESTPYGRGRAEGIARSHDMFITFDGTDNDVLRNLATPAFLAASPFWYTNSSAVGNFSIPNEKDYPKWKIS